MNLQNTWWEIVAIDLSNFPPQILQKKPIRSIIKTSVRYRSKYYVQVSWNCQFFCDLRKFGSELCVDQNVEIYYFIVFYIFAYYPLFARFGVGGMGGALFYSLTLQVVAVDPNLPSKIRFFLAACSKATCWLHSPC